jgi:hypothetical protein
MASRLFSSRDDLEICGRQGFGAVLGGDDNHMNSFQDFVLDGPCSSDTKLYATYTYVLIAPNMRPQ